MQKCGPGLAIAGIVLLVAALCGFLIGVPKLIDSKVKEETKLEEGSDTWNKWRDVTVPVTISFYFFHVKNPKAIETGNGEKFQLEERGPYVYDEVRQKHIININKAKGTVTYRETKHYYFNRTASVGPDTDMFNAINFPFVTLATLLKKAVGPLANAILTPLMTTGGEGFVRENVTIGQYLFDGFPINPWYGRVIALTGEIPEQFQDDKFGIYRGKNGSDDGLYEIYTGVDDHEQFGMILNWEGAEELPFWTNTSLPPHAEQYCNKINGSDGSIFPPFVDKDRILRVFVTDICRSIYLKYNEEVDYDGIPAYRFSVPAAMFEDPAINPDNQCFCTNPGGGLAAYCTGGLIRIYACQNDAPVVTSNPHFLYASDDVLYGVDGLKPDEALHRTNLDLEPRSGQLVQATKRVQIGIEIQPLNGIATFGKVPKPSLLVPIFWAEEHAGLTHDDVEDLKSKLLKPLKIIKIVQWVVVGVAGVVILIGAYVTYRNRGVKK